MGKYLKGNIDEALSLGTLAADTLVSAPFDETVAEKTLVSSVVATWSLSDFTDALAVGPISVGLAHSDYSDAEIEAVIESTGSWNEGDLVSQEVAKRLVRKIGTFQSGLGATAEMVLNDGKPIKTKLNWTMLTGAGLRLWAYNEGESAVATTVPVVRIQGHANLWPR